jgi:hypothetical protein
VKLTLLNSASRWKQERINEYPSILAHFETLERHILKRPYSGLSDTLLLADGRSVLCRRQSIQMQLFSGRIVNNKKQLSALYIFNDAEVRILQFLFTL